MADDKTQPGGQDRARININEDYEVRDWSQKLGVSPDVITLIGRWVRRRLRG